jgi:hypothetical protein
VTSPGFLVVLNQTTRKENLLFVVKKGKSAVYTSGLDHSGRGWSVEYVSEDVEE